MAKQYNFQKAWQSGDTTFVLAESDGKQLIFEVQGDMLVESIRYPNGQVPGDVEFLGVAGISHLNGKPCLSATNFSGYSRLFNTGNLKISIVRTRSVQPVATPQQA